MNNHGKVTTYSVNKREENKETRKKKNFTPTDCKRGPLLHVMCKEKKEKKN
jgi:hypothetical protein